MGSFPETYNEPFTQTQNAPVELRRNMSNKFHQGALTTKFCLVIFEGIP